MKRIDMINLLKNGYAEVFFTKADGTDREMHCTLLSEEINKLTGVSPPVAGVVNTDSEVDTIVVLDLEAKDWRSFRPNSVYEMYVNGNLVIPEPIVISEEEARKQGLEV